jgi:YbgC/YbaW family acyl-CoA thioester hydrolase
VAHAHGNYLTSRFKLRWTECDPAGIAFYPHYFEFIEVTSMNLAWQMGLQRDDLLYPSLVGIPQATTRAEFLSPSFLEDELEVRLWVTKIGTTSIGLRYEIWRIAPDLKLLVKATETRVLVGRDESNTMFPRPLTPFMRATLERYLEVATI